jgi:HopA1 effector protein family
MAADLPRGAGSSPAQLAPRLLAALECIKVANDCRSGVVADRQIEAKSTAEFTHRLSHCIYEVLHVGWPAPPADNVRTGNDEDFEARLLAATPHASVLRTANVLAADAGQIFVEMDGVSVAVPRTEAGQAPPGRRIAVRLPACRPALSPGYWVADGTRALATGDRIVRLYVHLPGPAAAVAAWAAVLPMLEERAVAFRAKVTSIPALLPRRDALVVYVGDRDLAAVTALGREIGRVAQVGPEVSVFAERIAPGVAIAWEPTDRRPGMRGLSFGEHRARAIAEGLVRHAGSRNSGTAADAVRQALMTAGIEPARPAWNHRHAEVAQQRPAAARP